jgi:paraquat-inducible protein A
MSGRAMAMRKSEARSQPLEGMLVNLLLLAALGLLFAGLTLPVLSLEKFYVFSNVVSLWSALQQLIVEGEWGLVAIIGLFSVVFPILKIVWLFVLWNLESATSDRHRRHLHWLAVFARWSMLDVFVVALLVVSVKLGALAQTRVEWGVYAFAASVVLSMLLSGWIGRRGNSG